ncbi:MAG: hypothetical protein AAF514_24660, partial [Verrucomicrobiota bacterium]
GELRVDKAESELMGEVERANLRGFVETYAGRNENGDPLPDLIKDLILETTTIATGFGQGNLAVGTFEIERPEGGWAIWDSGRVPFVIQSLEFSLGMFRFNEPQPFVGEVEIINAPEALPFLSRFKTWIREFEKKAELPEGSLDGDGDRDGQHGILEFVLGSDPTKGSSVAKLKASLISSEDKKWIELRVPVRQWIAGVTLEIQQSPDGKVWKSVRNDFELVERKQPEGNEEVEILVLRSKDPLAPDAKLGFFRAVVVE